MQVVLRVPFGLCIVNDNERGLSLPEGDWPRLRKGVAREDPLPWDKLQVCAMLVSVLTYSVTSCDRLK